MGFNTEPKGETARDWPIIALLDTPEVRASLLAKIHEYEERIYADAPAKVLGNILHLDYHYREQTHLYRTDAYLKAIYAAAVLQGDPCDTAAVHEDLYRNPAWSSEFSTIQFRDPHTFDALSWNAAEVIKEYATGARLAQSRQSPEV